MCNVDFVALIITGGNSCKLNNKVQRICNNREYKLGNFIQKLSPIIVSGQVRILVSGFNLYCQKRIFVKDWSNSVRL